jgi:dTDP-4-dehydrorhamnose reductase
MTYVFTGSNGLLGTELKTHWQSYDDEALWTTRDDMDITNVEQVWRYLTSIDGPYTLVHMAAYTDVAKADTQRAQCMAVNYEGTANLVRVCRFTGAKIVYISTDYVFDGAEGGYAPGDAPNPVNYYAMTKLMGEAAVGTYRNSLIVRTSFKPKVFPHKGACEDMWTSADYVDVIASKLLDVIRGGYSGIYHLGTERKSVYNLAKRRNPDVTPILRSEIQWVNLPKDTSFGSVKHKDWGN